MASPAFERSVCLVGAGNISGVHAQALRTLGIAVSAVVDPNQSARENLARDLGAGNYASIDAALAAGNFGRVHVLAPPDRHATTALPFLKAGKAVLIEKPLATTLAECDELLAVAGTLGVNQNFVYHPAFVRLREAVASNLLGRPRFVDVIYHAPLRQLAARQFGHWMFREPRNILLEQAVHPLSQLVSLCGEVVSLEAVGGRPLAITPETNLIPSFTASLQGKKLAAALRFAVGQNFPFWQVSVLCDDGVLFADILANRFWTLARTRWMDPVNDLVSGQSQALAVARASWKNILAYALSTIGLRRRSDAFFESMLGSIGAFHEAADRGTPPPLLDGQFGREMVVLCDCIAEQIAPKSTLIERPRVDPADESPATGDVDVAVLGGTGFIGTAVVSHLRAAGLRISVMARNLANLPSSFHEKGVVLHRGDTRNAADVARAIGGVPVVINLAHGGGGSSWIEIRDGMVGGVETVARGCLDAGTKRLVHISSIAALYLGPQAREVVGATPIDPMSARRADYARAKGLSEERLRQLLGKGPVEFCILRPGLVVGHNTSPFHSGLGIFNNDQHCIGWNSGRNHLPFVLVDDVADAIVRAAKSAQAAGKAYNLVGDFRPTARAYLAALAKLRLRPLKFHGKNPYGLYFNELAKWCIKRVGGRRVPAPSLRDILSRGLRATFDCSDVKTELGWNPVSDAAQFYASAFEASDGQ